jgi:hypothetical protein
MNIENIEDNQIASPANSDGIAIDITGSDIDRMEDGLMPSFRMENSFDDHPLNQPKIEEDEPETMLMKSLENHKKIVEEVKNEIIKEHLKGYEMQIEE